MPKHFARKRHKGYRAAKHPPRSSSITGRNERLHHEHEILTKYFNHLLNEVMSLYDRTTINTVVIDGIEITRRGKNKAVDAVIEDYRRRFWYHYTQLSERQISAEISRILQLVAQIVVQTSEYQTKEKVNSLVKKWLYNLDAGLEWRVAQYKYEYYSNLIDKYERSHMEPRIYEPTNGEPVEAPPKPSKQNFEPKLRPAQPIHPKKHSARRLLLSAAKLTILLMMLAAIIGYLTFATVTYTSIEEIPKIKITLVNESLLPAEISFKDYLVDIYKYEGENATLNGFLSTYVKGDEMSGVYVQSLVDDYGNRIDLVKLTPKLKSSFPTKGTTNDTYAVNGTFQRSYKTLQFLVLTIEPYVRPPGKQIEKQTVTTYMENITHAIKIPKYHVIRSFAFNLLGKPVTCEDGTLLGNCSINKSFYCSQKGLSINPAKCGCPEGKRIYRENCIVKVKCQDGTLEPECSSDKPKQCVNGKLIDNPELCGCHNDYKLKDKKCVYLKCSDGTLEPECSVNKPKQCLNGELIDNSTECGCPSDYKILGDSCVKIQRCSDKTIYGECSRNKPLFCNSGELLERSSICGCKLEYVSRNNSCVLVETMESQDAFAYLNELRTENGRNTIKWDESLYKLAVFRSKDMYDRKYFDHVTPEGKCVKDFQAQFGISDYNLAENIAAVYIGYSEDSMHYAEVPDPRANVKRWMNSRGHRYNLLYDKHTIGAIGCYKGVCVFLGGNNEPYGFGSGPCTTGAEGLSFWENVPPQEGEV